MKNQLKSMINDKNKIMALLSIISLMIVCRYIFIPLENFIMVMTTTKLLVWSIIGIGFLCMGIYLYIKVYKRADLEKALKSVFWMIVLIGAYGFIMSLLFNVSGETSNDTAIKEMIVTIFDYKLALLIQLMMIMIMAPLVEEFIYRFLMYKGFTTIIREKYDYFIMGFMSFTFAIIHVHYNDDWRIMLVEFLSYIVPAILLTYFYVKHKRIMGNEKAYYTNVLIHSFYNTFVFILMIVPVITYLIGS